LTFDPSFGHNLCLKYLNGSCEPILDIYIPRNFQWYKELFNPINFDPWNLPLKIRESMGTPIPKMRAHLGVCGFILLHSPTLPWAWNVTLGLHSWPTPFQAFALVASPRLGLWHKRFFLFNHYRFFLCVILLNHCQFSSCATLHNHYRSCQSSLCATLFNHYHFFFVRGFAQSLLIFFMRYFDESTNFIFFTIVIVQYTFHQTCSIGSFFTNVIWNAWIIIVVLWRRRNNTSNFMHQCKVNK
jgi:hypothetical protein